MIFVIDKKVIVKIAFYSFLNLLRDKYSCI